ncbi:hypothetical protein P5G61_27350 [Paenibacillus sp. F6_3S_P_1C]|uniref:Copper amine oxidase-like N-terminal domain-containing protein n=1 Tax=Paenibacillus vandeheii TaxID=3035917 RepID=A0ABT8JJ42_9BACL|nr:stalk domain-containing protein [Paenibacillus vandeheii]MDN4604972.1 hypothetical protein [Paenibacillus vandeheii]
MMKRKQGKMMIMTAVLMLSVAFSGLASAAEMKTIKKDGMELVNLRQAAAMYDYSIKWDSTDRSVTLMYMDDMDDMDGNMMNDDNMMDDDMTMKDDMMAKDDKMMKDGMMMDSEMKPAGKMIKVWIGSKKVMVDGKQVNLGTTPAISNDSTYVSDMLITKYMKPAEAMK